MENKKREIAKFYEQIFSDTKLKEKIVEKAKAIVNEEDLKKLIQQEIVPLMKKYNVNFSEKELLEYEEETLKKLSKEDLDNVSGGVSIKSALLTGGLLSMALLGGVGLNSSIADASKNPPEGPPNNKPGTTQQKSQKRKSASKFKPTTKKVKEQSDNDDDDEPRQSQRSEATESTKKGKEEHKQSVDDFLADYDNWKETDVLEFIEKNPAESIDEEKVQDLYDKLDNFLSENMKYLSKEGRPKIKAYLENIEPQNNSSDNDNDDDDKIQEENKKTETRKKQKKVKVKRTQQNNGEHNAAALFEKLKKDFVNYEQQKRKLNNIGLKLYHIEEYLNPSEMFEFISKLRVDNRFRFYIITPDKKKQIIKMEDIEEFLDCYDDLKNVYVPKSLFEGNGSGLCKAIIFGGAYEIHHQYMEGKITYNYTDILEIINNAPIEEAMYPQIFIEAIDEFRKDGSRINDNKIKRLLKYESKLDNGEETIDKAALRLGEFYKEFLELTKNDYEESLQYIGRSRKYNSGRIEKLIKGELDYDSVSVLVRKFDLLDEKTKDAVIKDTEYIASKIKKSGNIPFLEGRFTNYTIDANCLEIINGFNEILPYLLGTADNGHLTYTPCTKGMMGESLNTVAPRLIDVLKKGVYKFHDYNSDMHIEGLTGDSSEYFDQENLIDENFNKFAASAQKNERALNLDTIFDTDNDNKELLIKNVKEDIDYLHQYMKPNSDGTWILKGSMFSSGSKIDGLGMIDYFYNAPVLSLWDYEPCQKEELDAEDLSAAAQNLIKFLTEYTNLAQRYGHCYETFKKPMNSYSGTLDEKFDQFIGQDRYNQGTEILKLGNLNVKCKEKVKKDIKYLFEKMDSIDNSIDGLKMIEHFYNDF